MKAKSGKIKGGKTLSNIVSCEQYAKNKSVKYWDGEKYVCPQGSESF
jgi:hypothetical protein